MLAGDPLDPPRRLTQEGETPFGAVEQLADDADILGEARASLHVGAQARERLFLARLRGELGEFGDAVLEPCAVAGGGVELVTGGGERGFGLAPGAESGFGGGGGEAGEGIEEGAVAARI